MLTDEQRKLAEEHIRLCHWYVTNKALHRRDLKFGRLDYDEMLSLAFYGLCKATQSYDSSKGIAFATYASHCLDNEFNMEVRRIFAKCRKPYYESSSIDQMVNTAEGLTLIMMIPSTDMTPEEILCESGNCEYIWNIVESVLTDREKDVIQMYSKGMDQTDIGMKFGISQSYVSRIIKAAKKKIIDELTAHGYRKCV